MSKSKYVKLISFISLTFFVSPLCNAASPTDPPIANQQQYVARVMPPIKAIAKVAPAPAAPPIPVGEFARFVANNTFLALGEVPSPVLNNDQEKFNLIRQYFINSYTGVTSSSSIIVDGRTFDCIPIRQQPSLRSGAAIDTPPDALGPNGNQLILGRPDAVCPINEIPVERQSVQDVAQYGSLQNFLAKDRGISRRLGMTGYNLRLPPGPQAVPTPQNAGATTGDGHIHRYAVMYLYAPLSGITASLNVWNPTAAADEMSLSQTWIVGNGQRGLQTLESGWQVRPGTGSVKSAPFVYSTQDDYSQTGCYNLDCANFVQVTNQIVFASFADNLYSQPGQNQTSLDIEWKQSRTSGNWWLKLNGVWVGYYPSELFTAGDLASGQSQVLFEFGGENTGSKPTAQMGSGQYAETGFGAAAFQGNLRYLDGQGTPQDLSGLLPLVTDPKCYSLSPVKAPQPADTPISFYFGGPGDANRDCEAAEIGGN